MGSPQNCFQRVALVSCFGGRLSYDRLRHDAIGASIQTLMKNWWLLALCGVLEVVMSVVYLDHSVHGIASNTPLVTIGRLSVAAGVCTVAAALWNSATRRRWLLVLNGLALNALGLIFNGISGFRISLRTIALLIVFMAISMGIFELLTARILRRQHHVFGEWFLKLAGVASLGFALAFFALVFRWIEIEPGTHPDLFWFGSYFGFSAICMLGLAFLLRGQGSRQSGLLEALPRSGNPRPAI